MELCPDRPPVHPNLIVASAQAELARPGRGGRIDQALRPLHRPEIPHDEEDDQTPIGLTIRRYQAGLFVEFISNAIKFVRTQFPKIGGVPIRPDEEVFHPVGSDRLGGKPLDNRVVLRFPPRIFLIKLAIAPLPPQEGISARSQEDQHSQKGQACEPPSPADRLCRERCEFHLSRVPPIRLCVFVSLCWTSPRRDNSPSAGIILLAEPGDRPARKRRVPP